MDENHQQTEPWCVKGLESDTKIQVNQCIFLKFYSPLFQLLHISNV